MSKKRGLAQNIRDIKRFEQILAALIKFELGYVVDKLSLTRYLPLSKRKRSKKGSPEKTTPNKVVKLFEHLGGTFIKLGQLLSIRPDLLPHDYCDAFRKLQDNVPAFSSEEAIKIIEQELGKPIKKLFSSFKRKPITAASIGQVHEAILLNGERVAIKVQRPKIREVVESDIDILYKAASLIEKHYKPKMFKPSEIVKEFERYTNNELDYSIEARNINHFLHHLKDDQNTKIPKVYWDYSSSKVLSMEFIDGEKVSKIKGRLSKSDKKVIASKIVNSIYKQVFINGFFHADPHPGNIFVTKGNNIAFLDFGIVGYFDQELRENVGGMFSAMISAEIEKVAESMLDLGFVGPENDMKKLKKDLVAALGKYYNVPLKKIRLSSLFNEVIGLARKNNMKLPTDLVLLGKAVVTVEGLAVELDPNFNLVESSKPFVRKLSMQKIKPQNIAKKFFKQSSNFKKFISRFPNQAEELITRIRSGEKSVNEIDQDMKVLAYEIDQSSNRVSLGLMITGFLISSALLYTVEHKMYQGFPLFSVIGFSIALLLILLLIISMIREKRRY